MTALERGGTRGATLRMRLSQIAKDDYGTSIISFEEQMRGRLSRVRDAITPSSQVEPYRLLHETLKIYTTIAIWNYTEEAVEMFTLLRQRKIKGKTQDLQIAAIALANDAAVLTANTNHFTHIPHLQVENWLLVATNE